MIERLWRYFFGYLVIKVKGPALERFLNRMAHAGVTVWDTERLSSGMLVACVGVSGFRRARFLCRSQGWRVSVADKVGLPFFLEKLLRRKLLLVGATAALICLYVASNFVWFVQVEGEVGVPMERILAVAREKGLSPGVPIGSVDAHRIQQALLLQVDELAWAAVNLHGTLAVIDVAERSSIDPVSAQPGNVVASRDGLVQRVTVFRGRSLVEKGTTVKAGDVLISGFISPDDAAYKDLMAQKKPPYVHADGIVTAKVWYSGKGAARLIATMSEPTGKRVRALVVRLGNKSFRLGASRPPFTDYETNRSEWHRSLAGRFDVSTAYEVFTEVERHRREIPAETARRHAEEAAEEDLQAQLTSDVEVVGGPYYETEVEVVDGIPTVKARAWVEAVQDIREFESIRF